MTPSVGIGLRAPHVREFLACDTPPVDYVEVIADNYLTDADAPRRLLDQIVERVPVVLHSLGLNLLGSGPLDPEYLRRLRDLARRVNAPWVSDHLCWTRTHSHNLFDLLPVPWRSDLVPWAAQRAAQVQATLDRPFGLENLTSYVRFGDSDLSEGEFYSAVVNEAHCHFMLDLNNIRVSEMNFGEKPAEFLQHIDPARVLQIHLAGQVPTGTLTIDTHDAPVTDEVWALYRTWLQRPGAVAIPTLIEWDENVPSFGALLLQARAIHQHRDQRVAPDGAPA
jgi:hypothetical protein